MKMTTSVVSYILAALFSLEAAASGNFYEEVSAPSPSAELSSLHLENCQSTKQLSEPLIVTACNKKASDTKTDYGLRLFLIENPKRPTIRFESRGAQDSYYLKLSLFKKQPADPSLFILAETGAEFSYGVDVYYFDGKGMKFSGHIDAAVDADGSPSSVVPYLKIEEQSGKAVFRFTRGLLKPNADGTYRTIRADRIRYVIREGKLHELLGQ